jgi:hypothetical protein
MRNRFQTINIVINSLGLLLIILGIILLIPLIFVFLYGEITDNTQTLFAFLLPSLLAFPALAALFKKMTDHHFVQAGFQALMRH